MTIDREQPSSHLRLVPTPVESSRFQHSSGGELEGGHEREMRQHARAWMLWREQTGQINAVTAREQRYTISYFVEAMGGRHARQIGESDLARWRSSMVATLSPGTVRMRWRTAYAFLEWLVDEGKIKRNPARRIPTPKAASAVHRNLRPDQARAIHDACIDNRERLIVTLGFQLGMRRSEIARAQLGDFDFVARSLIVTGKGGRQRLVALTEEAERAIGAYVAEHRFRAGPLVRDVTGMRGLTAAYVADLFEAVAYRAGVKTRGYDGVGTHSARHTAGTDVAHRTNGNAVIVRDFLGHADLSTTDRYVGPVDIEEQRTAIEGRRYAS